MQTYFQKYLSSFQEAVAGLDDLLALLVSFYPQCADKIQAYREDFNAFLLRARKLFQNPLFLPFHMISFFFLMRDFEKRSEQCAREVTRIAQEEQMAFSDEELDMSDEEILALFNIPVSSDQYAENLPSNPPQAEDFSFPHSTQAWSPLLNPAYAEDPFLNPACAGDALTWNPPRAGGGGAVFGDPTALKPWLGLGGENAPDAFMEPLWCAGNGSAFPINNPARNTSFSLPHLPLSSFLHAINYSLQFFISITQPSRSPP